LLFAACSKASSGGPSDKCFVGDPSKPIEMVVVHQTPSGAIAETMSEGRVPLIQPIQGGKVLFISVRARNLDGCPVHITTSLTDPCTNAVAALEGRDVILKASSDGWLEPDLPAEPDNYSNLAACPTQNLSRDIDEQVYTLKVQIQDHDGRTQETSLDIVPFCGEPMITDRCRCECSRQFKLGAMCVPVDAGPSNSDDASVTLACDGGV
jgi:hypothetical protein